MSDQIKELNVEIHKKRATLTDLEQKKFDKRMAPMLDLWRRMKQSRPHWK